MIPSFKTLVAGALLAVVSLASVAQEATPGVDRRQDRQSARMAAGAASGALTPREQRRLNREQRAIARSEERAKADGTVTAQERRRLHHQQNRASRDIARQKHDRQHARRPGGAASGPSN